MHNKLKNDVSKLTSIANIQNSKSNLQLKNMICMYTFLPELPHKVLICPVNVNVGRQGLGVFF